MAVDPFLQHLETITSRSRKRQKVTSDVLSQVLGAVQAKQSVGNISKRSSGSSSIQGHSLGDGHQHSSGQNYKLLMQLAKKSGISHTNMGTVVHRNIAGTNKLSQHALGNAFDIGGSQANLTKMVAYLKRYAPALKELIYTPTGTFLGKGGRRFTPRAITRSSHRGHIHVSSDNAKALQALMAKFK